MALGRSKKRLGDLLLDEGLITGEQLEKALKLAKETGKRIGETLVENGIVTERDIMNALSHQLGIEIVSLIGVEISKELLGLVDASILRKTGWFRLIFITETSMWYVWQWQIRWIWRQWMIL